MTQGLRIAIADDEPDVLEYLRRALPRLGHEVVGVAATGRELLELCRETLPDLIITDNKMPELDGMEAVLELTRERPIAVLLVSADDGLPLAGGVSSDVVHAHLIKPIRQTDLGPAVAGAWQRFRESQDFMTG